jgi:hypothetical protein
MNMPAPPEAIGKYSVVFDGGTLEHVFYYPQALLNALSIVKTGGHFITVVPANSLLGHGFYQVSPDLFFQLFRIEMGFRLSGIYIHHDERYAKIYRVKPPIRENAWRHKFASLTPALLVAITQRVGAIPQAPKIYQSDYETYWSNSLPARTNVPKIFQRLTPAIRRICKRWLLAAGINPFFDSTMYSHAPQFDT